jgi:predicted secreted protein/putative hemolysin
MVVVCYGFLPRFTCGTVIGTVLESGAVLFAVISHVLIYTIISNFFALYGRFFSPAGKHSSMRSRVSGKTLAITLGICTVLVLILCTAGCVRQPSQTVTPVTTPTGTPQGTAGIANPASVYCGNVGGTLAIMTDSTGGQYGMCGFPNGSSCEEWALYRGEGCKPGVSATATPAGGAKMMVTFTQADNNTTKQVATGSQFAVQLASNPTTGYDWNATVSQGLLVTGSSYQQNANPGNMVGVGGNQMWIVKADAAGKQTFSAIYKQPWMPTTGTETSFVLYLDVA